MQAERAAYTAGWEACRAQLLAQHAEDALARNLRERLDREQAARLERERDAEALGARLQALAQRYGMLADVHAGGCAWQRRLARMRRGLPPPPDLPTARIFPQANHSPLCCHLTHADLTCEVHGSLPNVHAACHTVWVYEMSTAAVMQGFRCIQQITLHCTALMRLMLYMPAAEVTNTGHASDIACKRHPHSSRMQAEVVGHRELGRGGCGQVVLASHASLPRQFALKGVAADADTLPTLKALLDSECAMLTELGDHPNIIQAR